MNVSDIVRRVRELAGDNAAIQFSNEILTDWINDGIRECVIQNSLLEVKATSATVVGQVDYVLPADIFKLHSVWVDGYKLEILTLQEWEARGATEHGAPVQTGAVYVGYIYANVLTLSPTPDAVKVIKINYTKYPAAIAYNPVGPVWTPVAPTIPEAYHGRLITWCMSQIALQDDDYEKYAALQAEFKTGTIDLDHAMRSQEDLYPSISVSDRDAGDGTW